jgi:hypothetical protein
MQNFFARGAETGDWIQSRQTRQTAVNSAQLERSVELEAIELAHENRKIFPGGILCSHQSPIEIQ